MPKIARYSLVWSAYRQTYEWRESPGSGVQDVATESPALLEWMGQVSSFAFHGRNGSYSMCKEYKQRGEGYWYAYVRVKGKRTKRYLGRDIDLTLTRLERVAHELWQAMPEIRQQKDNDPIDQHEKYVLPHLSTDLLLATKLYVPLPRSPLVHRLRLIQQLQQGMDRTLILISAPVGFGKSTLLSEWLTSRTIRTAWLSLEPQDDDPVRFFSYLIAALQMHAPHLVVTSQVVFHPLHSSSIEAVLTLLSTTCSGEPLLRIIWFSSWIITRSLLTSPFIRLFPFFWNICLPGCILSLQPVKIPHSHLRAYVDATICWNCVPPISASRKTNTEALLYPTRLIPAVPQLSNYPDVIEALNFWRELFNSLVMSLGVTFGTIILSALAGYAFARLKFFGSDANLVPNLGTLMAGVVLASILPIVMFLIGQRYFVRSVASSGLKG